MPAQAPAAGGGVAEPAGIGVTPLERCTEAGPTVPSLSQRDRPQPERRLFRRAVRHGAPPCHQAPRSQNRARRTRRLGISPGGRASLSHPGNCRLSIVGCSLSFAWESNPIRLRVTGEQARRCPCLKRRSWVRFVFDPRCERLHDPASLPSLLDSAENPARSARALEPPVQRGTLGKPKATGGRRAVCRRG